MNRISIDATPFLAFYENTNRVLQKDKHVRPRQNIDATQPLNLGKQPSMQDIRLPHLTEMHPSHLTSITADTSHHIAYLANKPTDQAKNVRLAMLQVRASDSHTDKTAWFGDGIAYASRLQRHDNGIFFYRVRQLTGLRRRKREARSAVHCKAGCELVGRDSRSFLTALSFSKLGYVIVGTNYIDISAIVES